MSGSYEQDLALATMLQGKLNKEADKENNKGNQQMKLMAPSKVSLIDPDWETTDPCPDIHGLFLAFNNRFFYGCLVTVEVKWSQQMTSCAGVCVYEGRSGLCSVRLSAPLLKLRPRSDLVETLLHEMIHAYLFVTNNNKDRDGHGPEFHKHMYRINKEAGTNITVYHSFHAEVKVYQQHWWRCNGPCQHREPFFGMVKRAKNRAPGPYDLWWADHMASCGGKFVKIREPEHFKAKTRKKESKNTASPALAGKDITDYFKKSFGKSSATVTNNQTATNISGFNGLYNKSLPGSKIKPTSGLQSQVNRVTGFKYITSDDVINKSAKPLSKGYVLGSGRGGLSRVGTVTSRDKPVQEPDSPRTTLSEGNFKVFSGSGFTLGKTSSASDRSKSRLLDMQEPDSPRTTLSERNFKVFSGSGFTLGKTSSASDRSKSRLLDMQEPDSPRTTSSERNFNVFSGSGFTLGNPSSASDLSKGSLLDIGLAQIEKNIKIDTHASDIYSFEPMKNDEVCKCSVCNKSMIREEVDDHLENCVGLQEVFVNTWSIDESDVNQINQKYKITRCPICAVQVDGDINAHLDECLNTSGVVNVFEEPIEFRPDCDSPIQMIGNSVPKPKVETDCDIEIIECDKSENRMACPICGMRFGESKINDHVNQCLDVENDMLLLNS